MFLLESRLNNIEDSLSVAAFIPIVPGILEVGIGLIQTITAIAFLAFAHYSKNEQMKVNARIHIKHGLGNIAGGALRAIPLVGIIMWILPRRPPAYDRKHTCYSTSENWCRSFNFILDKPHSHKYMPYERLQLHELCVYVDDRMDDVCELKKYEGADLPLIDLNGTLKEEYAKLEKFVLNTAPFGKAQILYPDDPSKRVSANPEIREWPIWGKRTEALILGLPDPGPGPAPT